jgi:tetratricopeptide (TPR) repeat protein
VIKRAGGVIVVLLCAAVVIAYQATRPERAPGSARAFVPSPAFFLDFSPSFRTTIADAYYLQMVQYYGEHYTNRDLASMPAMVDLVATLSPRFQRAYTFGAFSLLDAGRPDLSVQLLEKGFKANPSEWIFPAYLGYFAYEHGSGTKQQNERAAARWYEIAAGIPGSPPYLLRLAAVLSGKGGNLEKAVTMWGQVYLAGDKYSQRKAVDGLDRILPKEKQARMKAVAPLFDTMPKAEFEALIAELFKGYR